MNRIVNIKADKRFEMTTQILYPDLSTSEKVTLKAILSYSVDSFCILSPEVSRAVKTACNLSDTAFTTNIHRLVKKGVIKKNGKTIHLPPSLHNLDKVEALVLKFV